MKKLLLTLSALLVLGGCTKCRTYLQNVEDISEGDKYTVTELTYIRDCYNPITK